MYILVTMEISIHKQTVWQWVRRWVQLLAGIFKVELERTILPTLKEHMSPWKRYVDDTISYIKEESIEHVLSKLNGYHDNIELTYEIENDGKLPFLDVLVIRKGYDNIIFDVKF